MIEFKDPYETLQQKGRAYMTDGKHPRIHVFSTSIMELDRLVQEFGGGAYRHGSGHIWVFSGKKAIEDLLVRLTDAGFLPSVHGFEIKLEKRQE